METFRVTYTPIFVYAKTGNIDFGTQKTESFTTFEDAREKRNQLQSLNKERIGNSDGVSIRYAEINLLFPE